MTLTDQHAFLPHGTPGDEALVALRLRLGSQGFEAAWAYGRSIAGKRAVGMRAEQWPGNHAGP